MWPSPVMRIDKVASACHTFMARHAKERMRTRRQQLDAPWCYHVLSPSQECPSFFILDGGRFLQHPRRSSCSPTEMAVCLRCGHVSAGPGQMRKTGTQTHTHTERCAHFHSDTLNHRTHTFHRTPFPSHTRFRCVCVCVQPCCQGKSRGPGICECLSWPTKTRHRRGANVPACSVIEALSRPPI